MASRRRPTTKKLMDSREEHTSMGGELTLEEGSGPDTIVSGEEAPEVRPQEEGEEIKPPVEGLVEEIKVAPKEEPPLKPLKKTEFIRRPRNIPKFSKLRSAGK